MQSQRFEEIVRKKEAIVTEMYLSDRELYADARRYAQSLSDLACEVQQLAFLNTALHKSKILPSFIILQPSNRMEVKV